MSFWLTTFIDPEILLLTHFYSCVMLAPLPNVFLCVFLTENIEVITEFSAIFHALKAIQLVKLEPFRLVLLWDGFEHFLILEYNNSHKKTNNNSKCNKLQNDHKPTKWCNSTSKRYQTKKKVSHDCTNYEILRYLVLQKADFFYSHRRICNVYLTVITLMCIL